MKGVIKRYLHDRGFGFIKDENGNNRYFREKDVMDHKTLFSNLEHYYLSDFLDRPCYVLNFEPGFNGEKLAARKISITDELFNAPPSGRYAEVKITDVTYDVQTFGVYVQGIKKDQGKPVFATYGGNGSYSIGYPETTRSLLVDYLRTDQIGWGKLEVRDLVLAVNGRSNITDAFVESLKQHLVNRTIKLLPINGGWTIRDLSVLTL